MVRRPWIGPDMELRFVDQSMHVLKRNLIEIRRPLPPPVPPGNRAPRPPRTPSYGFQGGARGGGSCNPSRRNPIQDPRGNIYLKCCIATKQRSMYFLLFVILVCYKYLAIENAVLRIQISDLNKDFVSLQSKRVCNGQLSSLLDNEKSKETIELEETFLALQKALDDKCKIQLENEAIKSEIKSLKNQVSRSRVQTVDVDDVIQDSLQLKAKLVQASCDTKVSLNEAHQSKKAVKPQKCLTLDQIERPLKFLNKHQHLSHQCQEYLRKMNVALLETLDIKEKLMTHGHKQNECLANRLTDLVPNSDG
mgnify:CR=1 FL=1